MGKQINDLANFINPIYDKEGSEQDYFKNLKEYMGKMKILLMRNPSEPIVMLGRI
jgi:hypothetical protein